MGRHVVGFDVSGQADLTEIHWQSVNYKNMFHQICYLEHASAAEVFGRSPVDSMILRAFAKKPVSTFAGVL